eukprot:TRINITY_DN6466_c0_g1_i1.p1 TRINITY_DN6466_c0_g1~~TRINITY_DN6466_c0_g1_i1.p1  ORF type:complete len:204 (-),score=37.58 TRINITY_DN6466_c0_g1_i1:156-728(-)
MASLPDLRRTTARDFGGTIYVDDCRQHQHQQFYSREMEELRELEELERQHLQRAVQVQQRLDRLQRQHVMKENRAQMQQSLLAQEPPPKRSPPVPLPATQGNRPAGGRPGRVPVSREDEGEDIKPASGDLAARRLKRNQHMTDRRPFWQKLAPKQNLVPCRICGRTFADDRIEAHEGICDRISRRQALQR